MNIRKIPSWVISEENRLKYISKKEEYNINSNSDLFFTLTNRIDPYYIEGIFEGLINEVNYKINKFSGSLSWLNDYKNKKPVYITFDGITLYKIIEIYQNDPFQFILKRLDEKYVFKNNQFFMMMPLTDDDLNIFYLENIKQYLKNEMNIDIYRANDFHGNDVIIETIYKLIEQSEIIIAETTYCNKNVFYEIGYAAAINKEIITIQNKSEKSLFFDRTHIRSIIYAENDLDKFKDDLKNAINAIRSKY